MLLSMVSLDKLIDLPLHVIVTIDDLDSVRFELLHSDRLIKLPLRVIPDLLIEPVIDNQGAQGARRAEASVHKGVGALALGRVSFGSFGAAGVEIVSLRPDGLDLGHTWGEGAASPVHSAVHTPLGVLSRIVERTVVVAVMRTGASSVVSRVGERRLVRN